MGGRSRKRKRSGVTKRRSKRHRGKRRSRRAYPGQHAGVLRNRLRTTMNYSELVSMNPATFPAEYRFRANSLFDPNRTGVGHQPRGFDQISPMYEHYTVIGAKLTATFMSEGDETGKASNYVLGVLVDNSASLTNPDQQGLFEDPRYRYTLVNGNASSGALSGGSVVSAVSIKKFLGVPSLLSSSQNQGTQTSNPTEDIDFVVTLGPFDEGTDQGTANVLVTIQYIAIWTEPKELAGS